MGRGMEIGWKYHIPGAEIRRISEQHLGIIIVIMTIMFPYVSYDYDYHWYSGTVIIIIILFTLFLSLIH